MVFFSENILIAAVYGNSLSLFKFIGLKCGEFVLFLEFEVKEIINIRKNIIDFGNFWGSFLEGFWSFIEIIVKDVAEFSLSQFRSFVGVTVGTIGGREDFFFDKFSFIFF